MTFYNYVIIGGGLAGGKAVEGIREVDTLGSIALVTQERHRPYHRPPLSKGYMLGQTAREGIYVQEADYYASGHALTLLTDVAATNLDRDENRMALADGRVLEYDKLLLATGGTPKRLSIPGNDLPGVFTLRRVEDADAIQRLAKPDKHALVLGGSFIGAEMAAALAQLGLEVTMVFPESRLLARIIPEAMSEMLHTRYAKNGVRIITEMTPSSLSGGITVERAQLANNAILDVDMVVMGVGIQLNTALAREAMLEMDENDAVIVDETLRTADPDIYAAGDIAAWPDATFDKRLRVEHWDVARGQGLRAGRNMAGEVEPYTAIPLFFSKLFGLHFTVLGDLSAWERTVLRGRLETEHFAYFYFHNDTLVGTLATGRFEDEQSPMKQLLRARPTWDAVADALRDDTIDLETLAEQQHL
jgi:3-phenylpropionate/trans-cinnamate dioxygenase ferredoxin reductase subunit